MTTIEIPPTMENTDTAKIVTGSLWQTGSVTGKSDCSVYASCRRHNIRHAGGNENPIADSHGEKDYDMDDSGIDLCFSFVFDNGSVEQNIYITN